MCPVHPLCQLCRIVAFIVRSKGQSQSVEQRNCPLLDGEVKGQCGDRRQNVAPGYHTVNQDIARRIHDIVHRPEMTQHNALGFSGGTGGIDKICQIFLRDGNGRLLSICFLQKLFHIHGRAVRKPFQTI